jgi:membrane protease YdiL (CAAX protease family)
VSFTGFKAVSVLFMFAFIIQALSEETVFRGFVLSSLTKKAGLLPAVIISSAFTRCCTSQITARIR